MLKSTLAAVAAVFALSAVSPAALAAKGDPHVLLTTSAGNIELELDSQKAPVSVKNFLDYVNSGFYNNTTFHRVIPGFMIQGGGFNEQMQQKQPNPPIKNEADNGLLNKRGTISMARTAYKDSATSQFFQTCRDPLRKSSAVTFFDAGEARPCCDPSLRKRVLLLILVANGLFREALSEKTHRQAKIPSLGATT